MIKEVDLIDVTSITVQGKLRALPADSSRLKDDKVQLVILRLSSQILRQWQMFSKTERDVDSTYKIDEGQSPDVV